MKVLVTDESTEIIACPGDRLSIDAVITVPAAGQTVFVERGDDATEADGFPVAPGGVVSISLETGEALNGIVAAADQDVFVLSAGSSV